jgi:hypothetical protein
VFLPFSQQAKSWEPRALELRRLAGLRPNELLDPWSLAPKVGLLVVAADEGPLQVLDDEQRLHLLGVGGRKWSGAVLPIELPDGMRISILNPTHSRGRHKSTLMEEIAHAYLKHEPTKLVFNSDAVRARDFNKSLETEAFGVGAAALLPWNTFFHCLDDGKTRAQIAEEYEVTENLVRYRIQITGAFKLYQARQRAA